MNAESYDTTNGGFPELIIRTGNREALNRTLLALHGGNFLIAEEPEDDGTWSVRAFPPESMGFLEFAIRKQGYAEIVGKRDIPGTAPGLVT